MVIVLMVIMYYKYKKVLVLVFSEVTWLNGKHLTANLETASLTPLPN